MSDIATVLVESLKALDPKRPIREADIGRLPQRCNPGDCGHSQKTGYGTGQGSGRLALPLQQQPTLGESFPEQNARRGCNEGPRAIHFHFNDGRKGKTPMHQLNAQMVCPCSSEPPDENSIGRMTLSRPEALNAIDVRMRVERALLLDQTGIPKRQGSVGRTWGACAAALDDELTSFRRTRSVPSLSYLTILDSLGLSRRRGATLRDGWSVTGDLARGPRRLCVHHGPC